MVAVIDLGRSEAPAKALIDALGKNQGFFGGLGRGAFEVMAAVFFFFCLVGGDGRDIHSAHNGNKDDLD